METSAADEPDTREIPTPERPPPLPEGTVLQRVWEVLPEFGFIGILNIAALAFCLFNTWVVLSSSPFPEWLKPVKATVTRAWLDPVSVDAQILRITFSFNEGGREYTATSSRHAGQREDVPPDILKPYAPGSLVTAFIWPDKPETASLFPRLYTDRDGMVLIAGVVAVLPIFGLDILAAWLIWIVAVRPPAAGLPCIVVPGRRVWVRLRWSLVSYPALSMLSGSWVFVYFCLDADSRPLWLGIVNLSIVVLNFGFITSMLWWGMRYKTELEADQVKGTLRVPVFDPDEMKRKKGESMEHQTLQLSDVECFAVEKYELREGESATLSGDAWLLVVRMASSRQSIPIVRYSESFPATVIGVYGVQILARWLNARLGLKCVKKEAALVSATAA